MRAPFLDDAVDDARDDAVATSEPCIVPPGVSSAPVNVRSEPSDVVRSVDIPPMDGSETREQRECRVLRARVRRLERCVTVARDDARMATRREHTAVANLVLGTANLERERGRLERTCEARIEDAAIRAKDEGAAARLELKRRIENRERVNGDLRERLDAARAALRDARARGAAMESEAAEVGKQRDEFAARIETLDADLTATCRRLEDTERRLETTIVAKEERERVLESLLANERARGDEAEAKLRDALADLAKLTREVEACRAAAKEYARRIAQAEDRTRVMERKVTHVRSRLADRERDLVNAAKIRTKERETEAERRREFESVKSWFDAQMCAMRAEHARLMALVKRPELPGWMS